LGLGSPFASAKTLLILGDSLTEGLGVAKEKAYPALVEKKLKAAGKDITVINGGNSGSTTASGPSRLRWHLKAKPDALLLALGANDGLRGLDLTESEKNLSQTIALAQEKKLKVILAGMKVPPNYGKEYSDRFEKMFETLAKQHKVPLIPFLLKDVGGVRSLNQADGIHPNEKGHEIIAETVFEEVKKRL